MAVESVLVLQDALKAAQPDASEAIVRELRERVVSVEVRDTRRCPPLEREAADVAVVLGGDGAFLGAARVLAKSDIPVIGVNLGRLGFLTEFNIDSFHQYLQAVLDQELQILPRMMLDVRVRQAGADADQPVFQSPAMNEVSILAGEPFRMMELAVRHHDVDVCTFLGDGLILSTPSGTTGHTLSAGGPILMPGMRAVAMTPIAAHSLSIRPVVMTADHLIQVRPLRANPGTTASIDGQLRCPLTEDCVVEVAAGTNDLRVVQNPDRPFFRTLLTKLQWGRSPHHDR